jgi:hypothetical protein
MLAGKKLTVLGVGAVGIVFQASEEGKAPLVVKCSLPAQQADESTVTVLGSVARAEADMARVLWDAFGATRVCVHFPQPLGLVKLKAPPFGYGFVDRSGGIEVLVMERLSGVPLPQGGGAALNLQKFIGKVLFARGGGSVLGGAGPGAVFRAAVFQVLWTLHVLQARLGALFRHNDLHAGNVGLTAYDLGVCNAEAVTEDVTGVGGFGGFVHPTCVRAVVLDFGYAALLPPLGPVKDSRFFAAHRTADGSVSLEPKKITQSAGMVQDIQCPAYDVVLFMVSVKMAVEKALRKSGGEGPPESVAVAREFLAMAGRVLPALEDLLTPVVGGGGGGGFEPRAGRRAPCWCPGADAAGRLTLEAQMVLCRALQTGYAVCTPGAVLRDEFFRVFRAGSGGAGGGGRGPRMEPLPRAAPLLWLRGALSALSNGAEWRIDDATKKLACTRGPYADLLAEVRRRMCAGPIGHAWEERPQMVSGGPRSPAAVAGAGDDDGDGVGREVIPRTPTQGYPQTVLPRTPPEDVDMCV